MHWVTFKRWVGPTECSGHFVDGRGVVDYFPHYERRLGRPVLEGSDAFSPLVIMIKYKDGDNDASS